ncbi:MAG: hypothetical protein ABJF10_05350 [Chthoniobacter sp.]|uniref:hypothetical protein n=1 Tax=Chthoniobacter sp. TaxID=2510640 RepID=UPI0032AA5FE9
MDPIESTVAKGKSKSWPETVAALAVVVVIFLVNVFVAERTPTVSPDEPPYVDPAANLYFGDGFVSTMWAQDRHAIWCGNVPLYQGVLYAGFRTLGFGLKKARWTNAILVSLGGLMIWQATRNSRLLQSPSSRILCLLLVLSGSVSTLTFRTLRPDAMMFVTVAAVFVCGTISAKFIRWPAIVLSAALIPFAGISVIPYAFILAGLSMLILGRPAMATANATMVGVCLGIGLLFLFYGEVASVREFLAIILPFATLNGTPTPLPQRILGKIVGVSSAGDPDNLWTCFFGDPRELVDPKILCDYGALLLFLLMAVVIFTRRRTLDSEVKRGALFIIAVVLLVPPSLHFLAHYRAVYRWMTYMPLCVGAPFMLERALARPSDGFYRRLAGWTCIAAISMGVPLRTLDALRTWRARSTEPIERAAAEMVRPNDVVLCNFKLYFAIRPHAQLVYANGLPARGDLAKVVDLPKDSISLLCLRPGEESEVFPIIGGSWKQVAFPGNVASALKETRYSANFFRRNSPEP